MFYGLVESHDLDIPLEVINIARSINRKEVLFINTDIIPDKGW